MNIFDQNQNYQQNQIQTYGYAQSTSTSTKLHKNVEYLIAAIIQKEPQYENNINQLRTLFTTYSEQLHRNTDSLTAEDLKSDIVTSNNVISNNQGTITMKINKKKHRTDKFYQQLHKQSKQCSSDTLTLKNIVADQDERKPFPKQSINQQSNKIIQPRVKRIKNLAIFQGNCEIPYLHSTDAINSLYSEKVNSNSTDIKSKKQYYQINPVLSTENLLNLVHIKLYYTNLSSLRSLGNGWSNLRTISACHCLLADIEGLSGFPKIQQLYLSYNLITDLSGLSSLYKGIKCLDLQGNQIQQSEIIHLQMMIELMNSLINCKIVYLNLLKNPLWQSIDNRKKLIALLGNKLFQESQLQEVQQDVYKMQLDSVIKQMENNWEISSYYNILSSNALIKELNSLMNQDQIIPQDCLKIYLKRKKAIEQQLQEDYVDLEQLDVVRYESLLLDDGEEKYNETQILFTHLYNFLPKKHNISNNFKKYLDKKLCQINQPKQQLQKFKQQEKSGQESKKLNPLINPMRLTKMSESNKSPVTIAENIYSKSNQGKPHKSLKRQKFTGVDFKKPVSEHINEVDQKFSKTETFRIQKTNHSEQKKTFNSFQPQSSLLKQVPGPKLKRHRLFEARDTLRKNAIELGSLQANSSNSHNKILPNIKKLAKICFDNQA